MFPYLQNTGGVCEAVGYVHKVVKCHELWKSRQRVTG